MSVAWIHIHENQTLGGHFTSFQIGFITCDNSIQFLFSILENSNQILHFSTVRASSPPVPTFVAVLHLQRSSHPKRLADDSASFMEIWYQGCNKHNKWYINFYFIYSIKSVISFI